jgi:hypothetical protein
MPLMISRLSLRGLPVLGSGGNGGLLNSHWASVRSVDKAFFSLIASEYYLPNSRFCGIEFGGFPRISTTF